MKNFMLLFLYQKKLNYFIVFFLLHIGLQAQEICNNGVDDDGDGYVDQYDPDCYTVPAPTCFAPAPAPNFQIELGLQGPANTLDVSISPTIGDIDGDGVPEIIAPLGNSATGYTTYHVVGGVLQDAGINFNIPLRAPVNGTVVQPAIADIDRDGKAEVITVGTNGDVYVFAHTGGNATTYKFISNTPTTIVYGSPRIADIDEDGVPEVIVGNHVFRFDLLAQTLTLVVNIPTNLPRGRDNANWGADIVVVDILPSNPGKEIVAGSVVYGVDMVNGTYTILKNLNSIDGTVSLYTDGPTAVADLDLDGDLDIVFNNGARVYVWDPVEDALLLNVASAGGNARRSMPTISNFYDDIANNGMSLDYPEILIGNVNILRAFNLQIPGNIVWSLSTSDSSGQTGITSFDFNGDGIQELIYNDETQIRIINGNSTTPVDLATFTSGTGTWMEHPVVADVDNDNQAEMIAFTGNPGAGSGQGRINIFKAGGGTIWQPARKVWNQRGYRVVNINDDLTVPAQETTVSNFMPASSNSYRVLNQFNAQLNPNNLLLEPGTVAATDVQLNAIQNFNLATGELTLDLSVLGGSDLPAGTPITIYNGDPTTTAATIEGTGLTPSVITSGTTQTVTVSITPSQSYRLYVIVNDNGSIPTPFNLSTDFPSTGMVECDYTNNMAFLQPPIYDTDGDGKNDIEDLDADNDGILNVDESHGYDLFGDADGDGILNFQDVSQGPGPGDGSITNYTDANGDGIADVFDTDGDGIIDAFDLDSDNDGCPDSNEYYGDPNADGGDGGQFGPGPDPVATNIDGTVSNPAATYTGLLMPVYTAVNISINTAMPDQVANIGDDITFAPDVLALRTTDFTTDPYTTMDATVELTYQWYVSTDGGTSFTILSGETSSTLTITNVQLTNDGYIYQVVVSHGSDRCVVITDDALLSITQNPAIALVKTASIAGTGTEGDIITYNFTVTNTGDVTLTGVAIDDALTGSVGLPVGPSTLAPGETGTATASYAITQLDIETGNVSNTATVTGTAPNSSTVTDTSGTALDNDDSTETPIAQNPTIALVKTSEYKGDPLQAQLGDLITFSFTVHNTGNINIDNIIVDDPLLGGNISGPLSGDTNNNSILEPTEIWVYEADYNITQPEVDNGVVENQATVDGTGSNGDPVNDISGTSVINDDETTTLLPPFSGISLVKTATFNDENGNGYPEAGETIGYSFTVENIGYQTLTTITVNDPMVTVAGGPIASLDPGDANNSTFTASYTITQGDIDAGTIQNTATATGKNPANDDISDTSGTAANNNDPTISILTESPALEATKIGTITVPPGVEMIAVGNEINFLIWVQNTGNVTLHGITLSDTFRDANGNLIVLASGPNFEYSDQGSAEGDLQVGETANYRATYIITQTEIDAGGITNSVVANGLSPTNSPVSDISDDGVDTDGNTEDDITEIPFGEDPSIEATKTALIADNGDGQTGVDDVITYTITVQNTGNVTLDNVTLTDTMQDAAGNPLTLTTGPTFTSSDQGSSAGNLLVGESATYTATYQITQSDVDTGGVVNSALATGDSPAGTQVNDISDNGNDADGNTEDDTTDTTIAQNPAIALLKTASIGGTGALGDVITYTFSVTNTGDITLTGVMIDDALTGSVGLAVSPATLTPGETGTATASYTIDQLDMDAGNVSNTATATGTAPDSSTVTDISGTALDNDDSTDTPIAQNPAISLVKTASVGGTGALGDDITYTFTVTNTGDVTLTGVVIDDTLTGSAGLTVSPSTLAPGEIGTATASYTINQLDIEAGTVSNTATTTGTTPDSSTVTDISGTGLDNDAPTNTSLERSPEIMLWKEGTYQDTNDDGLVNIGDHILFSFTVENTGNVDVMNVTITDPLVTVNGGPITTLGPGASDSTTFTAQYLLSQEDIEVGAVYNIAVAEAEDINGDPVTAYSQNPSPLDPNDPYNDPDCANCTITVLDQQSSIALIKYALVNDQNNDGYAQIGETITYSFSVVNTGNVMLTDIMVQDPLPGIVMNGGPIALAAGASDSTTFTGRYVITSQDLTAGRISNQATVSGLDPKGALITDVSDNQNQFGDSPTIIEIEECTLQVHNALSPNDDGLNDFLNIQGIECYPDNTVQIYNRWGVLVFEVDGYNNTSKVFQGFSDGRTTINRKVALPSGTYFYVLHVYDSDGTTSTKKGYLSINR